MKALTIVFIILVNALCNAQNQAKKVEKTISLESFSAIHASNNLRVILIKSDHNAAVIDGTDEIAANIDVTLKNAELLIGFKPDIVSNPKKSTKVLVYHKADLAQIHASSGAKITSEETIKTKDLTLKASSNGSIFVDIESDSLTASASSGGTCLLTGSTNYLNASASSNSDFNSKKLLSKYCRAKASGGSDMYVYASETFYLKSTGESQIHHFGAGKILDSKDLNVDSSQQK